MQASNLLCNPHSTHCPAERGGSDSLDLFLKQKGAWDGLAQEDHAFVLRGVLLAKLLYLLGFRARSKAGNTFILEGPALDVLARVLLKSGAASGKTSALQQLARFLTAAGYKVRAHTHDTLFLYLIPLLFSL